MAVKFVARRLYLLLGRCLLHSCHVFFLDGRLVSEGRPQKMSRWPSWYCLGCCLIH